MHNHAGCCAEPGPRWWCGPCGSPSSRFARPQLYQLCWADVAATAHDRHLPAREPLGCAQHCREGGRACWLDEVARLLNRVAAFSASSETKTKSSSNSRKIQSSQEKNSNTSNRPGGHSGGQVTWSSAELLPSGLLTLTANAKGAASLCLTSGCEGDPDQRPTSLTVARAAPWAASPARGSPGPGRSCGGLTSGPPGCATHECVEN
jgi:hypothetical protein